MFGISISAIVGFVLGGFFYHPVVDAVMGWVKHAVDLGHAAAKGPGSKK